MRRTRGTPSDDNTAEEALDKPDVRIYSLTVLRMEHTRKWKIS